MSSAMSTACARGTVGLGIGRRQPTNRSSARLVKETEARYLKRSDRKLTTLPIRYCLSRGIIRRARSGRVQALPDEAAVAPLDSISAPAPDDPIIGVMFTLAVVALSVLTLGVGYLSISSWLDSRQEEEDRKKSGFGPSRGASSDSGNFNTSAFTADNGSKGAKRGKKKKSPKKKSDKGFGA